MGSEVVRILLSRGYEVVVADDLSNPQSKPKDGYEFLKGDMGDLVLAKRAFEGVDACVALASRRGAIGFVHRNPTDILVGNNRIYEGTFRAASEAKVKRLVFISSSMVYESVKTFPWRETDVRDLPLPVSVFGFSKVTGERYCHVFKQAHGLSYTIIRPSNVYGPDELPGEQVGDTHVIPELFKKISSGQHPVPLLGDGHQTRCFVHVRDIAAGIVLAFESERAANEDFNMGGAEEISILELAKMIWRLCGKKNEFKSTSVAGFPQDVQRQFLDSSKARKLLGWCPQITFLQGLEEVINKLKKAT